MPNGSKNAGRGFIPGRVDIDERRPGDSGTEGDLVI